MPMSRRGGGRIVGLVILGTTDLSRFLYCRTSQDPQNVK